MVEPTINVKIINIHLFILWEFKKYCKIFQQNTYSCIYGEGVICVTFVITCLDFGECQGGKDNHHCSSIATVPIDFFFFFG
jgi:hypothetical protein